jgi:hypothetical protein
MAHITITHTRADGTLIDGSAKGDGVWEILRDQRHNWKCSRHIGLYLGQSRDRAAKTWHIERAAEALRNAGHEVTVTIDDSEARSFAEAEQERYERAEARAEYHEEHAGKAAAASDAAWQAEHGILDVIPMGQPILVGHHSERRHRRDLDRAEALRRRGMAESERSEYHADRAEAAENYQARRENIPTTLRRIAKLEADERRIRAGLVGRPDYYQDDDGNWKCRLIKPQDDYRARLESELAAVREELAYWREHVQAAEANGVKVWGPADFTKGDFVQLRYGYYEVLRVNQKSLTIPALISDGPVVTKANSRMSWTDTVPYDKVTGRKSAEEMATILAEVERREAEAKSA